MNERFWMLDSPSTQSGRAEWDSGMCWSPEEGSESDAIRTDFGGPATRLTELKVTVALRRFPDFLWTWYHDCLFRDEVLDAFEQNGFTGFQARPVSIRHGVRNKVQAAGDTQSSLVIPRYWELFVSGWGGVAPPESGISQAPLDSYKSWIGLPDWRHMVDRDQWDGSDFLIVWPYPGTRIVTDRVAECILDHKFKGVKLTPLDQLAAKETSRDPMPDHLSEYLPTERVAELKRRYAPGSF